MHKPKHLLLTTLPLFLGVVFACCIVFSNHAGALAPSNYTNYLIDDAVFTNNHTMSALAIQGFLNNEGSGLAGFSAVENCGSTSGPHYSYYATYYACGQNASAAQIIYAASQAYDINPQVILATLQKEQSLITTPDPTASQLNCAMGYQSCSSSYTGFFSQVDNATWQFRTYMDLGSGLNWWGYTPSDYPCNSSTSLFSAPLIAGNNVTFSDANGTHYANITLENMSTASLYCYTPYVYNNPSGLYGNPTFGTTGLYYSGSYNFVNSFVNWWGSTYTPSFQATYVGQSSYPTLIQGQSTPANIRYQNTGNQPWYDAVSAPLYNTFPVHLATSEPVNGASSFSSTWPTNNRPSVNFAAVYNSDGVTLASNQHVVQPGQIVVFNFTLSAPSNLAPGTYTQYVQPILEGSTLWNMGGLAWWNITVQPVSFQATYVGQSSYPTLIQGQSTPANIRYQNTGNQPWYDAVSAPLYNTFPVHLATSEPVNGASSFSSTWPTNNRPSVNFAAVYNSDGVTLASNQHVVQPGQIVVFNFTLSAPSNLAPGTYTQYVQPILEGSTLWNMGGLAWWNITVQPVSFQATYVGQSSYPTLIQGQSTPANIRYQNTGNQPWYDAVSAPLYNTFPVHLATSEPVNGASSFSSTWPTNNRPSVNFAAVYNSDGVTLASNQHVVQPGQIVVFNFTLSAPSNLAPGTYTQYVQPILEGSTLWNMGGLAWWNITVQP